MGTAGYGDNLTGNRFECVIDTLPFPSYALFMQVELTPEQASFIALGIQEGRFRDSEEAVRIALAQWEKRERVRIEMLASIDAAERSLDAGEGEDYTDETLGGLVQSVKERGASRLAGT
jgi:Arc/MetJ-type ribon-helix-helix transcriptional regulator